MLIKLQLVVDQFTTLVLDQSMLEFSVYDTVSGLTTIAVGFIEKCLYQGSMASESK